MKQVISKHISIIMIIKSILVMFILSLLFSLLTSTFTGLYKGCRNILYRQQIIR